MNKCASGIRLCREQPSVSVGIEYVDGGAVGHVASIFRLCDSLARIGRQRKLQIGELALHVAQLPGLSRVACGQQTYQRDDKQFVDGMAIQCRPAATTTFAPRLLAHHRCPDYGLPAAQLISAQWLFMADSWRPQAGVPAN